MKKTLNNILAFSGGMLGASLIFLIWFFLNIPFPETPIWAFLSLFLTVSLIEEGVKFLLIKRDIGQWPYGFTLGLGFGLTETVLINPFWEVGFIPVERSGAIVLHIITAGILSYYVKKNKALYGLTLAILLHTLFNVLVGGLQ